MGEVVGYALAIAFLIICLGWGSVALWLRVRAAHKAWRRWRMEQSARREARRLRRLGRLP